MSLVVGENASAQTTSAKQFSIPSLNSEISFVGNVSYASAELQSNTWYFTGLLTDGKPHLPIWGHLHISAKDCTVSIYYLQSWSQPEMGTVGLQWIKYHVYGAGIQTFDANDLFPNSIRWTRWTVTINDQIAEMGQSWNYTDSKQLIVQTTQPQSNVEISVIHEAENSSTVPLPNPQPAAVTFTSIDYFLIPSNDGVINFAVDGSYDKANLHDSTWQFTNLTLSNFAINAGMFAPNVTGRDVLPYILQAGNPATLDISTNNCNITISGITPLTWYSYQPMLNYTVQGNGTQTFTLPYKLSDFNWIITIGGTLKQSGDGWSIISANQIKVEYPTKDVTIVGMPIEKHIEPFLIVDNLQVILAIIISLLTIAIGLLALIIYKKSKAN